MKEDIQKGIITNIEFLKNLYEVKLDNNIIFYLEENFKSIPKIGDRIELQLINNIVKKIIINDTIIFNKTDEEIKKEEAIAQEKYLSKIKEDFAKNKFQMDLDFKSLPTEFKNKILRLRLNNRDFRERFEKYEIFVCKEAIKIAEHFKDFPKEDIDKEFKMFQKFSFNYLSKIIPLSLEHSEQTYTKAVEYAYVYLIQPNMVYLLHGALSDLVGCKVYGCAPATEDEIKNLSL